MALNEQMKEAIQEDIADTRSREERLKDQMEGLKSAGKFIGETAVESIPGVGEEIASKRVEEALAQGDKTGAAIEAAAMGMGLVPIVGDVGAKVLRTIRPKKTVKAYKLFTKGEDGNLYPLFVDADTPIKKGEYIEAIIPESVFTAPNGKKYVPSKGTGKKKGTGDNITIPDQATRDLLIEKGFLKAGSKAKSVKAVALRPGWHAGDSPAAPHIGNEYKGKKFRGEDQVWAEVEMPADVDWQSIANKRAELKKDGTPNVKTAHITDELPLGGFYRYKTNPNMQGNWLISGQMKINRVLDADEVKRLNKEAGVKDLPTLDELKAKKMAKGGAVMDDYQFAELEMEEPQKFAEGGMSKQMNLFDDGGLMQEGGTVDPESGNEVPVGSTQEEVRDDIPAQLSEGEFVFPADVVRYIGLENLMRMRQEAKMGLAQMESMGQMGNSEEATMPDDLPFDMYDLEVEEDDTQEFAQGGVVKAQAGTFVQPQGFTGIGGYQASQFGGYQPQYTPYTPPTMPTGQTMAQQYSPVQQQAVPTISQQAPTFTSLTGTAAPSPGGYDETKTYVNDAGMEMQIPFKDGNPIYPIPEGFKLKTEAVQTAKTTTTTDTGVDTARPSESDEDEPKGPQYSTTDVTGLGYDRAKIENEDLLDVLNEVGFDQISDFPIGPSGMLQKGLEQKGIGFRSGKTSGAVFGGVMDVFRGMEGNKFAEMALHEFSDSQKQSLADTYKEVSEQMKDIYTEVDENGKEKFKSAEEIKSSLASKLSSYGLDPKDFRSVAAMERAVATEIAKDVGGEVREAAKQQAAAYGVETKGKSVSQIRAEVEQKKKEALERAKSEAAARARRQQYESDGGGDDTVSQQASQAYSSTGQDRSSSSAASYSGRGATGEFGMAKGGLVYQMEKSGLTPKK